MKKGMWNGVYIYKFVIIIVTLVFTYPGTYAKCDSTEYEHNKLCCKMCPPGTYVKKHCDIHGTQTECIPCKNGTYLKTYNSQTQCNPCRQLKCTNSLKLGVQCGPTSDNECHCKRKRYYLNKALLSCMPCLTCPKGKYPESPCTAYTNTICKPCPENTFSNRTDLPCEKCRQCEKYKMKCSSTNNAICDLSKPEMAITQPTILVTSPLLKDKSSTVDLEIDTGGVRYKGGLSKGYIVVAGSVTAGFVFVVVCGILLFVRQNRNLLRYRGLTRTKYTPLRTGLFLRDQSAKLQLNLHRMLNTRGRGNWKDLAVELEFPLLDIQNYETNVETAPERVLTTWGTSNSATVDKLHAMLFKIGRHDIAKYLADNISDTENGNKVSLV